MASRRERGDFQTPMELARTVCARLWRDGVRPEALIEPSCGEGSMMAAALERFPGVRAALGVDIEAGYLGACRERLAPAQRRKLTLHCKSFFDVDWTAMVSRARAPMLIIGNPPWVTSAALGALGSENLPAKTRQRGLSGLAARTGKSNFDLSEWLIARMLDAVGESRTTIAMLCKTSVARRLLVRAWKHGPVPSRSSIYEIDAQRYFGAACDACLLVCRFDGAPGRKRAAVYESLAAARPASTIAFRDGKLIADLEAYRRWSYLEGEPCGRWRSGVKHDCAAVMELWRDGDRLYNRLGETPELEPDYLYPLLKSSEVFRRERPRRLMLVTQRRPGDPTSSIAARAPRTWHYLMSHAHRLDGRGSSIYRNRPRFCVFGVGPYTFAPWKVAVSGLYKSVQFAVVGRHQRRPVVFDDTCYFAACDSERDAATLVELLDSPAAQGFLSAFVFRDAKRPITAELLNRLDLDRLAEATGSVRRAG